MLQTTASQSTVASENKPVLVLIPSSRFVDRELQLEVGKIPPVLIPINGKVLLEFILERYPVDQTEVYLLTSEGTAAVMQHVKRLNRPNLHVIEVPTEEDLGSALVHGLKSLDLSRFQSMIINFGDTLVGVPESLAGSDAVVYDEIDESFRWTTFKRGDQGIRSISDRFQSDTVESACVFTGVFSFSKPEGLLKWLEQSSAEPAQGRFYSALQGYLSEVPYALVRAVEWDDFGHVDNYYQAKKRFVNKRFFNRVEIDQHRAVLTKKSSEVDKFTGEIRWYLELPASLKCYIPQVFDYSLSRDKTYIRMEYYGYPTLSELFLFEGHTLGIWSHAIAAIFRVVEEMRSYQLHAPANEIKDALTEMYLEKSCSRLAALVEDPLLGEFILAPFTVNGVQFRALKEYIEMLPALLEHSVFGAPQALSVIHGDLCLSNILFDPKTRIIKLIDPRGRFGSHTIYGDYRYELAKLCHSFNGRYEAIINDRFFAIKEPNSINFVVQTSAYQDQIAALFNRILGRDYASELNAVEVIEALLFLSMIPLHADHPHRQIVMLATGAQRIDKAVRRAGILK
ncbi:MAG: phosphotransferase [Oligoflexia bacterium]|nr:phosphotransferase [Oligoflexia bacterium]